MKGNGLWKFRPREQGEDSDLPEVYGGGEGWGRRPDLAGGGLIRGLEGRAEVSPLRRQEERVKH